jgi:hypothetical protein
VLENDGRDLPEDKPFFQFLYICSTIIMMTVNNHVMNYM